MKRVCNYLVFIRPAFIAILTLGASASAQQTSLQVTSLRGTIDAIGQHGIMVFPTGENFNRPNKSKPGKNKVTSQQTGEKDQPIDAAIFVAAGLQTEVRMNILATPDKIMPGAYVEMRVRWDGQSELRATSIKFPEGFAKKIGLYKG